MKKYILIALLCVPSILNAQTVAAKLAQAFQILQNDEQAKYALASLCVLDAQTGKIIFANNENIGLATASTLKTITAATALSLLGQDFTYQTQLAYTGKIDSEGVLKGDILIIGNGDPTLGSWRYENTKEQIVLNTWVNAIKNVGIKKVEGKIIGVDSLFGTQSIPEGWIWQDLGNYYGAGTSALSWHENQFDIHLKPGNTAGSEVTMLKTSPKMPYIKLVNELKTGVGGSGDNAYAFLAPYTDLAYLRGTWGLGINKKAISLSSPDPAFDVAFRLRDTLNSLQIFTSQDPSTSRRLALLNQNISTNYTLLNTINSPKLTDIVYWFNKKSVNLYGEQLIKTIALKSGKQASTKAGVNALINYWAARGIDKKALNILDGSGLSPGNSVTTLAMASILFQIQKEEWFAPFYNSLPDNNGMKLKSGSINDVSAYAGYYTDQQGNKYIAVININNYNGSGISKKLFKVLDALK